MTEKLFWVTRRIWSVLCLGSGVLLLVLLTSFFFLCFAVYTIVMILFGLASKYEKDVWMVFDVLWNVIFFGERWETFSSRLGKIYWHGAPTRLPKWFVHRLVWMLDKVDDNHCKNSVDWNHGWTK